MTTATKTERDEALAQLADERAAENRAEREKAEAAERVEQERLARVEELKPQIAELDRERAELKPQLKEALRQVAELAECFTANAEERRQAYNALLKLEPDTAPIPRDRQWGTGLGQSSVTSDDSEKSLMEQAVAAVREIGGR